MDLELNQLPINITLKFTHGLGDKLETTDIHNIETNHCLAITKTLFRAISALANGKDETEIEPNLDISNLTTLGIALVEKLEETMDLSEIQSFQYDDTFKLNGNS